MLHGEGFVGRRNFISPTRDLVSCAKEEGGGGFLRRPSGAHWDGALYQFFVMRMPNRRGSVTKIFVVSALSSEFRNAPVMTVVSSARRRRPTRSLL